LVTSLAMLTQFDAKPVVAGIITVTLGVVAYLALVTIKERRLV
jgi:hypothetical protein